MSMKGAINQAARNHKTMNEYVSYMPFEEILKAKFRGKDITFREAKDVLYSALIKVTMAKTKGNIVETCKVLQIDMDTLYRYFEKDNSIRLYKKGYAHDVSKDDIIPCKTFPRYAFVKGKREIINVETWKKMTIRRRCIVNLRDYNGKSHCKSIDALMREEGLEVIPIKEKKKKKRRRRWWE